MFCTDGKINSKPGLGQPWSLPLPVCLLHSPLALMSTRVWAVLEFSTVYNEDCSQSNYLLIKIVLCNKLQNYEAARQGYWGHFHYSSCYCMSLFVLVVLSDKDLVNSWSVLVLFINFCFFLCRAAYGDKMTSKSPMMLFLT